MKKKTKLILTSAATIVLSASLIAGGTLALFTDNASVNVALQAGDVDIEATVVQKSLETFSIAWNENLGDYESLPTATTGVFTNGGTAEFNNNYSALNLNLMSPGDSVKFTIDVENKSNISIQYRVVMEATGGLADALVATANIEGVPYAIDGVETKATLWQGIPGGQAIDDIQIEIDFPNADDNNNYKNESAVITYAVEAVQGNGHVIDHKVDATTKLQNAFTVGGNVEAPGVILAPTQTIEMGRKDVTLGNANLNNKNLSTDSLPGMIMTQGYGSNLTLAEGAIIEVVDLGRETYAVGSIYNGDVTMEEGSKITVSGAESVGIMAQNFGGEATKIYLNGSNLIEVANGATGISLAGGGNYEIYVETYADYLYYKAMTVTPSDGTAQNVTWYINGDAVEAKEAVLTTGESVATALTNGSTKITVNGDVSHKGSFANGDTDLVIVGTGAETSSIKVAGDVHANSAIGMNVTFKDITVIKENTNYNGLEHAVSETYDNCVIEGQLFLNANDVVFNNCTFVQTDAEVYNVWTYGARNVTFNNCTINSAGKSILVYNEGGNGSNVTFNACELNATAPVVGKAAVEIDSSLLAGSNHFYVTFNNTVANGFAVGSKSNETLYNEKNGDKATVYVDGEEIIVYGLTKNVVSGEYSITNVNGLASCGDVYFEQGGVFNFVTDLDMEGVAYIVPNITKQLVLNGNGYAISNLKVIGGTYAALLGRVSTGVKIENLTIKNSTFNSTNNMDGEYTAATFVAWAEIHESSKKLEIVGCTAENVTLGSCKYVGGIVAYQSGLELVVNGCSVISCNIVNNYYEMKNDLVEYKGHAGGVVGAMYNGTIINTTVANTTMEVESARGGIMVGSILDKTVSIAGIISNVTFNGVANAKTVVGYYDNRVDKSNSGVIFN